MIRTRQIRPHALYIENRLWDATETFVQPAIKRHQQLINDL